MTSTILLIALSAFLATFLGGQFALRYKDKLHLILGFSAGALIAVAFFDLLPEAIELGVESFEAQTIILFMAIGFFAYMILDRFVILHSHHSEETHDHTHEHGVPTIVRGKVGAGSLSVHSFLDGVAIGLAFQVSTGVGAIVAAAVLVHDFSDGINTVNMILKNGGTSALARKWLALDAIAPVLGIFSTMFFSLSESALSIILAIFCGFFLYIGASDLLPESHHQHPTIWTTMATLLGVGVLYGTIQLAGI